MASVKQNRLPIFIEPSTPDFLKRASVKGETLR